MQARQEGRQDPVATLRAGAGAVLAGLMLWGCATQSLQRADEDVRGKCDALHGDARLDPLRAHIPVPIVLGQPLPVEQLADRGRVSSEGERDAIKALEAVRGECRRLLEAALGPLPRYRYDSEDRITESLADLYAGSITWGQFNKALLHIGERDRAARENLEEELKAYEKWKSLQDIGGY